MNSKANIAQNVRTLVRERSITNIDLAAHVGVSEPVFYKRLKGESKWKLDELDAIADYFGVPTSLLLSSTADVYRYLAEQVEQLSLCLTEVAA